MLRFVVPLRVSTHRRHIFSLPDFSSVLPSGTQTYHEQKTFPYTRQQVYNVVSDVDSYRHFVPFCTASKVLSSTDKTKNPILLEAELTVQFLAFKESYVSRVTCIPLESVQAVASSSTPLFKELTTTWRFQSTARTHKLRTPHPDDSSPTLVSLDLAYAFANPIHAAISSSFFGQVSRMMVVAFERRCAQVYGGKGGSVSSAKF